MPDHSDASRNDGSCGVRTWVKKSTTMMTPNAAMVRAQTQSGTFINGPPVRHGGYRRSPPPGAVHDGAEPVSYTHLRAHETRHDLVCRLLLEKKKTTQEQPYESPMMTHGQEAHPTTTRKR